MAQLGDQVSDLIARQLPALARFCPLRDLNFDFLARVQIFGRHAKAAAGDLFDRRIGIVAIIVRSVATAVLSALARHRLGADPVHRNRQRLMRLRAQRAQRHARRHKPLADLGNRLNLIYGHAFVGEIELEQIAQVNRRQIGHSARKLQVG